jgi:hypothetical protein
MAAVMQNFSSTLLARRPQTLGNETLFQTAAGEVQHAHEISGPAQSDEKRHFLTPPKTLLHRVVNALPSSWREPAAERLLRREGAPGPASEHAVQYLLSIRQAAKKHPSRSSAVLKGADSFYQRQYRQWLNPVMGAFAMTATQAVLGAGASRDGGRRRTIAAMVD